MSMARSSTVAAAVVMLLAGRASGFDGITEYGAMITAKDRVSSKGVKLGSVPAILAQDRANYHRFKKRDKQDANDGEFTTPEKRLLFSKAKIQITPELKKKMLSGKDVEIWVLVHRDETIDVVEGPRNTEAG
ncbi:MAG: hypothetical protein AAGB14_09615 [Verrucomicrobiota bacterium]